MEVFIDPDETGRIHILVNQQEAQALRLCVGAISPPTIARRFVPQIDGVQASNLLNSMYTDMEPLAASPTGFDLAASRRGPTTVRSILDDMLAEPEEDDLCPPDAGCPECDYERNGPQPDPDPDCGNPNCRICT